MDKEKLKDAIGERRFLHTLGVMEMAAKLARKYGVDEDKARTAALYHDCAKFSDRNQLLEEAKKRGLNLDGHMRASPELIHAPLGAIIAREDYGITDHEVLEAIRCHTTGKEGMSKLDKIIYLADFIEPQRNFPGVDEARRLAEQSLDEALAFSLEHTINYLKAQGAAIAPATIKAWESLKEDE